MASEDVIDLRAEVLVDTILEVRMGKMKKMKGLNIESGIDKAICSGPVQVGSGGIEGDEHDYTFHGGPDKAVHGYCKTHYPSWASEFPTARPNSFVPGGFGENIVVAKMNERNICIGDVVSISNPSSPSASPLLLQVSLPRQPCFKLNERFSIRDFAPNTYRLSRTGWYYRVLRPGLLAAGMEMKVVKRPHPTWTIERIQEFLHRRKGAKEHLDEECIAALEELVKIEEFGEECRGAFRGRIAKARAKRAREARAKSGEVETPWREFRCVEKKFETPRIVSLVLEAVQPSAEVVEIGGGSHCKLRLPSGLVRTYSIVSGTSDRLTLGVTLADPSRGGSRELHTSVDVGTIIEVNRRITEDAIPGFNAAGHRALVAGGVGLTAFLAMAEEFQWANLDFTLHLAVRSEAEVPFRERLAALGERVKIYDASAGRRMDLEKLVRDLPWNSAASFCGPPRLMEEALRVTKAAGMTKENGAYVHFEAFAADVEAGGDPFEAVVSGVEGAGEEKTVAVGAEESLLEALQRQFGEDVVSSSCEVGNCGTCRVTVRGGCIDHRGTALSEDEKAGYMLACVSRGMGRIAIEV